MFKKLFAPKWEPLVCRPDAVIELFGECLAIDAPISELEIEYDGKKYNVGMTADYSREKGYFDLDYYLDGQHFRTLEEFMAGSMLDGIPFVDAEQIKVLKNKESGDPRSNVLLQKREIR